MLERNIKKIFVNTYKLIDEEFLSEAKKCKPTLKDGTTATTLLLLNNAIYCANVGDSKAIICRYKSELKEFITIQLSTDHNPMVFEERQRIQRAGGTVKDGRVMGIMEVSRSIGDGSLKSHGVICTPEVKKFSLTLSDLFILLACDGLWKSFSAESAMQFIIDRYKAKFLSKHDANDETKFWMEIADEICADAIKKGCGDNVSVMIIVIVDRETLHKILFA